MAAEHSEGQPALLRLLNKALASELHLAIQYTVQHGIAAGREACRSGESRQTRQRRFAASQAPAWLPGATLKKFALAETHHAEAIAARITILGGAPTTEPEPVVVESDVRGMLVNDEAQERAGIALSIEIIGVARAVGDEGTRLLFAGILRDEERHAQVLSGLLKSA